MKNMISLLTGLALTFSAGLSLAEVRNEDQGVYICGLSPNNMIGLAQQHTIFLMPDSAMITDSIVTEYTYQVEQSRTHQNDLPQVKAVASGYEITARMYSSETAAFIGEQVFSLDTKALSLTFPGSHLTIPCQKTYPGK